MNLSGLDILRRNFSGELILPQDSAYERARSTVTHQGAPALVLRPHSSGDVVAAVRYAQSQSLVLSVRSGGHGGAGFGTNDGGLVIDLSALNGIEILGGDERRVRIGAGATWGTVARVLGEHGLALSSGDTKSVGVGGLTLGGGIGWMVRKYGLALDSLVAAEVVTADGRILRADVDEHADLFWAIRGGGGNFGVVTSFEFTAHPLGRVYAGSIQYGIEALAELLAGWRQAMRSAPEELNSTVLLLPSFGGNPPGAQVLVCYGGDDEATARKAIQPLLELGQVIRQDIREKDYADVLEEGQAPPGPIRMLAKNVFVEDFSDGLIRELAAAFGRAGNLVLQVRSLGGAMRRIAREATAFAHRNSEVMLVAVFFLPPSASESDIGRVLKAWESIAAFGSGSYANFISTTTEEDVAAIYPRATYERLAAIKKIYDPHNVFDRNYNIKPAG